MATIVSPARTASPAGIVADGLLCVAATLAMLAPHVVRGFPTLADGGGDNDSQMRLVQVRDLLAGQGWFDPMQYRMGLDGGFEMHWSRLVDAPIAALVSVFGEPVAVTLWPALLFGLCLLMILRAARVLAGPAAVPPALVVGGMALYFVDLFSPGSIDHHNVQLALALATLVFLLAARNRPVAACAAGACAALMLAIGMETAPQVAAACGLAALLFLFRGAEEARPARDFGIAFAATAALILPVTLPLAKWTAVQCDAYSFPQASLAVLGGFGLAVAASLRLSARGRIAALGLLALAAAMLALTAFPECLADPYAGLDPRLKRYWLDAVSEAQPATAILTSRPAMFAGFYATPILALCLLGGKLARREFDRRHAIVAAFVAVAFLVSLWQVRGSMFSLPLAAIPLAAWIAAARTRAATEKTGMATLAMVAAWLLSVNMVWQLALAPFVPARQQGEEAASGTAGKCYGLDDHADLARLPAGTVLTISNLGSSVLRNTPHRVLAGPYHRNVAGNLATLDMLMGAPDDARAKAAAAGIDYVVLCPGNVETASIARWAPDGLLAKMRQDEVPAWLEPIPGTAGRPLSVYRVLP